MRILLIGERYSENLGDAVICETVRMLIQQKLDAKIIDFDISGKSGYNQDYSLHSLYKNKYHGYKKIVLITILRKIFYWRFVEFKRYLRVMLKFNEYIQRDSFDVILFAGGALFQDYFAELIFSIVKQCRKRPPAIIFHACGLGKISFHSKKLLKKVFSLEYVKDISIRDSHEQFVFLFGNKHKVTDTYDTALCCSEFYKKSNKIVAEYGIGCINCENTYNIQKDIIRGIMNSGVTWRIFTNGALYDEKVVDRLLYDLGIAKKRSELVLPRAMDAEGLIANITSFQKIISFRLHSHVIAASFGIPSYGFVWDSKVREFFIKLDIPERCKELTVKTDNKNFFRDIKKELEEIKEVVKEEVKQQADLSKKDLYRQLVEEAL